MLHLHTEKSSAFTTLDSTTKYEEYIDRAKEYNMESIAFTEHGNVLGWINKKRYSEEHGLKYIHGVEAYITEGLTDDIDSRVYDNFHVILLARNYEGVKEINKLLSQASVRSDVHTYEDMSDVPHYYYQPRITYKDL
ncbi:MAG TPA: PHP domain-containing protein, partial [Tissierellaceae bacterium]|nr:PHP domain-containing protein [Tissierellaceae bacterium]